MAGDTRYPCLAVAVRSLAPPALVYYQLCGKFRWHGGHNCCISVASWEDFATVDVDAGELGRLLPEYLRLGAAPRACADAQADADRLLQAIETARY